MIELILDDFFLSKWNENNFEDSLKKTLDPRLKIVLELFIFFLGLLRLA